jgi:hypothetical protein
MPRIQKVGAGLDAPPAGDSARRLPLTRDRAFGSNERRFPSRLGRNLNRGHLDGKRDRFDFK